MNASVRTKSEVPSRKHFQRLVEIRDAAAAVFAEKGFHGCSVQDVADALRVNKATLYHYVQSKEQLLFDILTYADRQVRDIFSAAETSQIDPLEATRQAVAGHVRWYLRHPDIARVAFRDWSGLTGEMLKTQIARRRSYSHRLRELVLRCRDQGLISQSVNVTLAANFINGAVSTANVWFRPSGTEKAEVIAEVFGDMAVAVITGAQVAKATV